VHELRTKNQPEGLCFECIHNKAKAADISACRVPYGILVNEICIQKNILSRISVIAQFSAASLDEQDEANWWKDDEE